MMTMHELLDVLQAWSNLGWSVQEQAAVIIDGTADPRDLNPTAVEGVIEFLEQCVGAGILDGGEVTTALERVTDDGADD